MKKRIVVPLALLSVLAALPQLASTADKSAAKLEVTYYYLPT